MVVRNWTGTNSSLSATITISEYQHTTSHLCDLGAIRKKFSISMLSGVVDGANFAFGNRRKNSAVPRRNSIQARCIPRHERAPAPNGEKIDFASAGAGKLWLPAPSSVGSHLVWSNLYDFERQSVRNFQGTGKLELTLKDLERSGSHDGVSKPGL